MAEWLGPAKQTFTYTNDDGERVPCVGWLLYHYIPGTDTPKDTWQDPDETDLNSNPIILDEAGQCAMFGDGLYRERFTDPDGNQQWDNLTGNEPPVTPETATVYFDQELEFLGPPPETLEVLAGVIYNRAVHFFADFDGSGEGFGTAHGVCLLAPTTGNYIITIKKNGAVEVGLITITQTTGVWTFSSFGVAIDLIAGDYLTFHGQAVVDATLATLFWSLPGKVS